MGGRIAKGRLVGVAGILAGSLLIVGPARGEIPVAATTQTASAQQALIASCTLSLGGWGFNGFERSNGTIYGTFTWTSSLNCTNNMRYMRTLAHLTKLPNSAVYRGNPGICGVDSPGPAIAGCKNVSMSGGAYYCDPCNGTWALDGEWQFRYALAQVLIPRSTTTFTCTSTLDLERKCTGRHPQLIVL